MATDYNIVVVPDIGGTRPCIECPQCLGLLLLCASSTHHCIDLMYLILKLHVHVLVAVYCEVHVCALKSIYYTFIMQVRAASRKFRKGGKSGFY